MAVLTKPAHEQFAQLVVSGKPASQAYSQVYGEAKGADQSASRLLRNVKVAARIAELGSEVAQKLLGETILERSCRLKALENRWHLLNRVIAERAEIYGKLTLQGYQAQAADKEADKPEEPALAAPGAGTGLMVLDYRGRDAQQAIWKVDTGLLAELRHIEEQIAREKGEWNPEPNGGGVFVPVQVNVTFVSPTNG